MEELRDPELNQLLLNSKNDESKRKNLILNHLKSISSDVKGRSFDDILQDNTLEWFNVKRPLTVNGDLKGKLIILDFFTYCCINCIHAISSLEAIEREYPTDKVVVIGIHSAKFDNEKITKNVQDAVRRYHITHPVVNDTSFKIWNRFSVRCWPTVILLDTDFKPVKIFQGERYLPCIRYYLDVLLRHLDIRSYTPLPIQTSTQPLGPLFYPGKLDLRESVLCIVDSGNNRLLIVDIESRTILYVIGNGVKGFQDGNFENASFNSPQGCCFYSKELVYLADTGNHSIRLVNLNTKSVVTVIKNGVSDYSGSGTKKISDQLLSPWDVCIGPAPKGGGKNSVLYIAMAGTHQIWGYSLEDTKWWKGKIREKGACFVVAGTGREENRNNCYPHQAAFAQPSGLCYDSKLHCVFIADSESSTVRRMNLEDGSVRNVCGGVPDPTNLFAFGDVDGKGMDAKLQHALGLTMYKDTLMITDTYNHKIKTVNKLAEKVAECTTFPGLDLKEPSDIVADENKGVVYIADTNHHRIVELHVETRKWNVVSLKFVHDNVSYDHSHHEIVRANSLKINFKSSDIRDYRISVDCRSDSDQDGLKVEAKFDQDDSSSQTKKEITVTIKVMRCEADLCFEKLYLFTFEKAQKEEEEEPQFQELEYYL